MPAVSGRYIVCPFCNSKKCKKECKSKKEGGISMYDKIYEIIQSSDDFVWGWGMIALLLGTHLFLTVRTGVIQRKTITKGIRLSVAKEEGADGEVSQFGALATALASTIGTGNIIGVGTAIALGGPGAVFWCWITGIFGIAIPRFPFRTELPADHCFGKIIAFLILTKFKPLMLNDTRPWSFPIRIIHSCISLEI